MQLKFLACLRGKFHSAYSPYALNELNLALTHLYNKVLIIVELSSLHCSEHLLPAPVEHRNVMEDQK